MKKILLATALIASSMSVQARTELLTDKVELAPYMYAQCKGDMPELAKLSVVYSTSDRGIMVYNAAEFFCPLVLLSDSYNIKSENPEQYFQTEFIVEGVYNLSYTFKAMGSNGFKLVRVGDKQLTQSNENVAFVHNQMLKIHNVAAQTIMDTEL